MTALAALADGWTDIRVGSLSADRRPATACCVLILASTFAKATCNNVTGTSPPCVLSASLAAAVAVATVTVATCAGAGAAASSGAMKGPFAEFESALESASSRSLYTTSRSTKSPMSSMSMRLSSCCGCCCSVGRRGGDCACGGCVCCGWCGCGASSAAGRWRLISLARKSLPLTGAAPLRFRGRCAVCCGSVENVQWHK